MLIVAPATVLVSTPDCTAPVSVQVKVTVTLVLFQPLALASGVRLSVITGLVLSMLMFVMLAGVALLPAPSLQDPLTD